VVNNVDDVNNAAEGEMEASCSHIVEGGLKCYQKVIKENKEFSSIKLLGYTLVDGEVRVYFSRFDEKFSIQHFLDYILVCLIEEDELCLVTLQLYQTDTHPQTNFVFVNKGKENNDFFFYMYDCIYLNLHVSSNLECRPFSIAPEWVGGHSGIMLVYLYQGYPWVVFLFLLFLAENDGEVGVLGSSCLSTLVLA